MQILFWLSKSVKWWSCASRAVKTAVSDKIIQHFITRYLHNPETRYMMWLHPRLPPRPLPDPPPPPPRPCCCRCPRPPADRPLVDPLGAELTEVLQLVEVPEVVAVQVTQLIRLETERLKILLTFIKVNIVPFITLLTWNLNLSCPWHWTFSSCCHHCSLIQMSVPAFADILAYAKYINKSYHFGRR